MRDASIRILMVPQQIPESGDLKKKKKKKKRQEKICNIYSIILSKYVIQEFFKYSFIFGIFCIKFLRVP